QAIMHRAVGRGLQRRGKDELAWVGMDEKSFRKGHDYISLLNDLEGGRVLDVVEGRDSEVAEKLLMSRFDQWQREMVCGVAIDMSAPYWSTTIILPRPATIKIPRLGVCDSWFWLLVVFGVVLGGGWVAGVP
ncbi:MAG: transposase, partial [Opitutae bacterium]